MNRLHLLITILTATLAMAGCRDNEGPYASDYVNYDIVTLASQSKEEGSRFVLYRPDSDTEIVYSDSREIIDPEKVKVGDRLLLGYTAQKGPYVSGPVTATGYSQINNDTLRVYTREILDNSSWDRDPIYVYSIWRAGPYLNVHGRVTFTDDEAIFRLGIVDENFVNETTVPQLYLIYQMKEPAPNFQREFYASFDISKLWNEGWCRGIDVNVNNSNLKQNLFQFRKQNDLN